MKPHKINQNITFGANGNIGDYALRGWSLWEKNPSSTWTEEPVAGLQFSALSSALGLGLRVCGLPFLGNGLIKLQNVQVHLNGLYCGMLQARSEFDQILPLQSDWLLARGNQLVFTMPQAQSPADLGLGEDRRLLGVCLSAVTLVSQ